MQLYELKCFGLRPGEGNAAIVIEGNTDGAEARQAFAAASNKSACVFIDASDDPGAAFVLDYFYPHMRSPLCLHATLAAAQLLLARQDSAAIVVKTALHGQTLRLSRAPDGYYVGLAAQAVAPLEAGPGLAAALLGAPGLALASAPRLASVGSPKLLIEVSDAATLAGLRPDLSAIVEWGKANGVNGCYAYCRLGQGEYAGRNFNHLDPALEDSATGVAAGALTALLGQGLTLYQGAASGQPCVIRTRLDGAAILVGGAAERVA